MRIPRMLYRFNSFHKGASLQTHRIEKKYGYFEIGHCGYSDIPNLWEVRSTIKWNNRAGFATKREAFDEAIESMESQAKDLTLTTMKLRLRREKL